MSSGQRAAGRPVPPRFCGACGGALAYAVAFCHQCGASVNEGLRAVPGQVAPFARGGDPGMIAVRRSDLRFVDLSAGFAAPARVGWAERSWARFQRLSPLWQVVMWVLCWWALATVLIWRRESWAPSTRWGLTALVALGFLIEYSWFT